MKKSLRPGFCRAAQCTGSGLRCEHAAPLSTCSYQHLGHSGGTGGSSPRLHQELEEEQVSAFSSRTTALGR